jgi:hypothetical protein
MFESEALKSLGPWPLVQAAVAIVIIFAAAYAWRRGEKDKRTPDVIPQWLMMGPLHDMMGAVHDVAEETRRTNDLLREVKEALGDVLRETQNSRNALEMIRNESRLR